jgi:hypothetical protein
MKSDPLLWIAAFAIIGCLLVLLANIVLKMHKPLDRNHVEQLADKAHRKNEER